MLSSQRLISPSLAGVTILASAAFCAQLPAMAADTPTGPAGGDLQGTYPNPRIAVEAVTAGNIAPGAVRAAKIYDGAVRSKALGVITQRSATSANIVAGGNGSVTASCLAGEQVIAGGNDGFFDVYVVASRLSGNGWAVFGHNASAGNRTITAHVYCLEK